MGPRQAFAQLVNQYYLDPVNGNDAHDGLTPATAWQTWDQCELVVVSRMKTAPQGLGFVYITVLNNVAGDINIIADWQSVGPNSLTIDGWSGRVAGTAATLTTVTAANAATPTDWRIAITGFDFSTRVGQYAEVTSGPRAGNGFFILKDLGTGNARIGEPHLALSYVSTPGAYAVQAGDPITFYTLVKFGDTLKVTGSGDFGLQQLRLGTTTGHDQQFVSSTLFVDSCSFTNFDCQNAGGAFLTGCYFSGNIRAYQSADIVIGHGGSNAFAKVDTDGIVSFFAFTFSGGGLDSSGSEGNGTFQILGGYLSISDTTTAVHVGQGNDFIMLAGTRLIGTGVTGTKIIVDPGASLYYDATLKPNMTGAGSDSTIGAASNIVAIAAWPSVSAANGAKAVPNV